MLTRCIGIALLLYGLAEAATVSTVSIDSEKMGKPVPVTVILPEAYGGSTNRFPVLYLLHGAGDTHAKWMVKTGIEALADEYGVIVVCPDGGRTSWYFDSPVDPSYQYDTFVAKECVAYVDKHYRTRADRFSRALCGNSMGGHGSLVLAIRNRDAFSIAVPLSGGVDIRPFPDNWDIKKRLGSIETHAENWEKYTAINLAKGLKEGELAISIDCGDADFFLEVNRTLHAQLLEDAISHEYAEHPGGHDWSYWDKAIERQMPFIVRHFEKSLLKPTL